jgi:hypothetical protein
MSELPRRHAVLLWRNTVVVIPTSGYPLFAFVLKHRAVSRVIDQCEIAERPPA